MSNNAGLRRRFRIAGALLMSMFALSSFAGNAIAGWSPATTMPGSGPSADGTTIAGLPNGQAVVAWTQPAGGQPAVYASRLDPDGNAGPAVLLSTAGQATETPVVALASNGNATVAWVRTDGTNAVVQSNTFSAAGAAGSVVNRSASGAAGEDAVRPRIAAAANGSVAIVWRKFNGTNWIVQSQVVPASGSPGAVQDFQPLGVDSGFPDVAAKPDGTFELAWAVGSMTVANVAFVPLAATGLPGQVGYVSIGTDNLPKNMESDPDSVSLGIDSAGVVTIVWRLLADRAVHTTDPSTDPPPDLHWSALSTQLKANAIVTGPPVVAAVPVFISPKTDEVSQLTFASSPGTDSVVAWKNDVAGSRWIETAKMATATLGVYWYVSPRLSDDVGSYGFPRLAVASGGARTVVWQEESAVPGVPEVQVMRLTPEGAFDGPSSLAPAGALASDHAVPVMAASGVSTVAFDMKDSGSTDVAAVSRFTDPGITVYPGLLAFGDDLINIESPARSISIVNSGSTSNQVTAITLSGANAGQFTVDGAACLKQLVPDANCQVGVNFRPTSSGTKTATVQVDSVAGSRVVNIQGTGVARTLVAMKVKPAKQALRKGKSVKVPVTVSNTGGITANNLKVCAAGSKKVVRPRKKCLKVSSLTAGSSRKLHFKVKLNGKAKAGTKYPVVFQLHAANAGSRIKYVNFALKGKKKG